MTNKRRPLPNRRSHETIAIESLGQRFKVGLGRELRDDGLGPICEVFLNAQKPNSTIDVLANDGAILMSLAMQYGCPIDVIRHAMKRDAQGQAASPLGRAADLISEGN